MTYQDHLLRAGALGGMLVALDADHLDAIHLILMDGLAVDQRVALNRILAKAGQPKGVALALATIAAWAEA